MKYRLSDIMCIIGGGTPNTNIESYWNGDIPWLSVKDFNNNCRYVYSTEKHITELGLSNSSTELLRKNDIIISARGTVGEIAMIPFPMAFNQSCYGLRAKENIVISDFLYYLLKSLRYVLKKNTHGSVFDTITRDTFEGIEVELFPLPTQQRIAKILSSLDDKIELNNSINKNLEEQMQAMFKSWFVDFEPFGGVMPSDWEKITLGEIAHIGSGKRPPKLNEIIKENYIMPVVGASGIMGYCSDVLYNEPVLIIGRVGTHGIVQRINKPCWASDNTLVIKSVYYEYVYQILKNIDYSGLNRGSTQPLITQRDIKNTLIILPNIDVLKSYERISKALLTKEEMNIEENIMLTEIRDTLLPKLMSGEIDVDKVEI